MSYFANNKLYDYYEVDRTTIGSQDFTEKTIEIINNESILFDLSKLNVLTTSYNVLNSFDVDTIKIHIDWGDGKTEKLTKPLISNRSTIGVYKPNGWKMVEHVFVIDKSSQKRNIITITAFNSFDEKLTVKIPYTMIYKTIYDLGSEFSLFSANTTNTNKVSYTLKQINSDSLVILSTVDEKEKVFGEEDEQDEDNLINTQFSDEFIDQDFMVWDWNSLPIIIFNETSLNDDGFTCSFKNEGIEVESWYPQVKLISDKNEEKDLEITKNKTDYLFHVKCEDDGIYEVFLSPLTGMNGSNGQSGKTYVKKVIMSDNPRHIRQIVSDATTISPVILGNRCIDFSDDSVTVNQNKLVFNFTLADPYQLKSLTKLDLILQAVSADSDNTSYDFINDISFKFDVLSSLFDDNGNPNYIKDQDGEMKLQYVVRMKDIPNKITYNGFEHKIKYRAWFETNDVLGGEDNVYYTLYDEELGFYKNERIKFLEGEGVVKDECDSVNTDIYFDYKIGHFEDGLEVKNSDNHKIDKQINLSWNFIPYDYWENFIVNVYANGNKLLMNDFHTYQGDNNINHLFSGLSFDAKTNTFNKVIDGNKIPDGKIQFDVIYRSEMNEYYDIREEVNTTIEQYTYPTPIIQIDDINPYITIDYDKNKNTQRLKLNLSISGSSDEQLREIYLTKEDILNDQFSSIKVSKLMFEDSNLPFVETDVDYIFSAFNKNDNYNRRGSCTPKKFKLQSNDSNFEISRLKDLPSEGKDYLAGDITKQYLLLNDVNSDGENPVVDWMWVKQNTLHDIDKYYKIEFEQDGISKLFFTHQHGNNMTFENEKRWLLYDIVSLQDGDNVIRRFRPILADTTINYDNYLAELSTADDCLSDNHQPQVVYNGSRDKCELTLRWDKQNWELVKNMFLKVYKLEEIPADEKDEDSIIIDNKIYARKTLMKQERLDVDKKTETTFRDLPFGFYNYDIILNSEEVKTINNTKRFNDEIKLFVNYNECVKFYQPTIKVSTTDGSKLVQFKWDLYHTSCEYAKFFYGIYSGNNTDGLKLIEYDGKGHGVYNISIRNGENVFYGMKIKSDYVIPKGGQDYSFIKEGETLIYDAILQSV